MLKFFQAIGAAALCISAASHAVATETTLKLGTDGAYPPYISTNPAGELVGMEFDLFTNLCQRINVRCEWVTMEFDGLIPALQNGKFDAIVSTLSITDKRRETIDFSVPYSRGANGFVASKALVMSFQPAIAEGSIELDALTPEMTKTIEAIKAGLEGKSIGFQRGTSYESFLRAYFGNAELRPYDKEATLLLDLAAGRIDLAFSDDNSIATFIEDQKKQNAHFALLGGGFRGGLLGEGIGVGLRKDDPRNLRKMFNEAIFAATEDGTISKLTLQWTGVDSSLPLEVLRKTMQ